MKKSKKVSLERTYADFATGLPFWYSTQSVDPSFPGWQNVGKLGTGCHRGMKNVTRHPIRRKHLSKEDSGRKNSNWHLIWSTTSDIFSCQKLYFLLSRRGLNSASLRSWKIFLNNAGVPFTFASVPPCGLPSQQVLTHSCHGTNFWGWLTVKTLSSFEPEFPCARKNRPIGGSSWSSRSKATSRIEPNYVVHRGLFHFALMWRYRVTIAPVYFRPYSWHVKMISVASLILAWRIMVWRSDFVFSSSFLRGVIFHRMFQDVKDPKNHWILPLLAVSGDPFHR